MGATGFRRAPRSMLTSKAEETIIPTLDFFQATPAEALKAVSASSGLQVHYTPEPADKASLTLKLANVPASEALKLVAGLANLTIAYRADGIYLQSAAALQKRP